jgi:hypothetical protein
LRSDAVSGGDGNPGTAGAAGDKKMNDPLQQLKVALQFLALPVIGQLRLVEDDCAHAEVLAETFTAALDAVHTHAAGELMAEQAKALARLEDQLARVRQASPSRLCSELAMRESSDWRLVRMMAREALVRFGWRLEIPVGDGRGYPGRVTLIPGLPRRL